MHPHIHQPSIYKWPLPYSIVARDFLIFLEDEVRAPGSGLRQILHEEVVGLDPRRRCSASADSSEAGEGAGTGAGAGTEKEPGTAWQISVVRKRSIVATW